jgi:uncharacterized membrane protein YgcG
LYRYTEYHIADDNTYVSASSSRREEEEEEAAAVRAMAARANKVGRLREMCAGQLGEDFTAVHGFLRSVRRREAEHAAVSVASRRSLPGGNGTSLVEIAAAAADIDGRGGGGALFDGSGSGSGSGGGGGGGGGGGSGMMSASMSVDGLLSEVGYTLNTAAR